MSRLRTGKPLVALDVVEDAEARELDVMQRQIVDTMRQRWIIDEPAAAARRIAEFADRFDVDEVMMSIASAPRRGEPLDRWVGRERALELLSEQIAGGAATESSVAPAGR